MQRKISIRLRRTLSDLIHTQHTIESSFSSPFDISRGSEARSGFFARGNFDVVYFKFEFEFCILRARTRR